MKLSFLSITIEPSQEPFSIFPVDVQGSIIAEPDGKRIPFHFGAVDIYSAFGVMQTWVETHAHQMLRSQEVDNDSGQ